jgi:hypothetical protein
MTICHLSVAPILLTYRSALWPMPGLPLSYLNVRCLELIQTKEIKKFEYNATEGNTPSLVKQKHLG